MSIMSVNPTTGETIKEYPEMTCQDIADAVTGSHRAFLDWRRTSFSERAHHMRQAAELLRRRAPDYAFLMAREMGKPIRSGRSEVEKCAWACQYFADNAEGFLRPEALSTNASKCFVTFQPLGVVLAVMPWNFPFWQVFRFAAPALMAGNSVVLKHASNVPGCALAVESVFRQAGFPAGVFRTLLVSHDRVEGIIEHPAVRAVTITGGTEAGRAVARKAGEMLKKTVLELGGSDPYVVLNDADLNEAATACVGSRLINSGQTCIAAKRFIVVESQRELFEELCVERMRAVRVGDPTAEDTEVGPLASRALRYTLHRQVTGSISKGARCLLGGQIPEGPGAFYPPTVLTGVTRGMPAYDEETFGPVAAIVPVKDESEAVRTANDSRFGLGAAVFTGDVARGEWLAANEIEAGCCFVNTYVQSDPRLPFGGIKDSGYGRELSHYGIKEFVNIKTVLVK
ncbi:MAG: NAD-dependent succinate-semialdehyde dehydrogenase [Chloroflexi bacterium]|nr:NAD-dependent succinate-semialdehyde dehydrogenase [Chloroflexota bacterium]